jgi:hypothetical protein
LCQSYAVASTDGGGSDEVVDDIGEAGAASVGEALAVGTVAVGA